MISVSVCKVGFWGCVHFYSQKGLKQEKVVDLSSRNLVILVLFKVDRMFQLSI